MKLKISARVRGPQRPGRTAKTLTFKSLHADAAQLLLGPWVGLDGTGTPLEESTCHFRRVPCQVFACKARYLPPTLDSTCSCAPLSSPHTFKSLTRQCLCNLPSHRFLHACQQQYKDKPIHRYANRTREDGPRGLMPEYALAQRLLKTKRLSYMSDDLDLATTLK